MRGSLVQRYKGSRSVVLDLGYEVDPATGKKRRKQQWITVRGTRREAQAVLAKQVHDVHRGDFVKPTKRTFGEWLDEWLDKAIKPPAKAMGTYQHYRLIVERHLKPKLSMIPLQQLKAQDLKRHYVEAGQGDAALSSSSLALHQVIAHSALKAAMLEGLVQKNVATLVIGKPRPRNDRHDVLSHCWDADEARTFLAAAKTASSQQAAFYALALDSGMRRNELAGLRWTDLDLARGRVKIERQLIRGRQPTFGPVKKCRGRSTFRPKPSCSFGSTGATRPRSSSATAPATSTWDSSSRRSKLTRTAGVRLIKFHGLRHTCATLLLRACVPPHVVQQRLGHRSIAITLGVYAHALPAMQQDAAAKLAALLHGE